MTIRRLFAVLVVICTAAPAARQALPGQPTVQAPASPAPLTPAQLEQKIDELLKAHVTVNDFSGAVLFASKGQPLVAKGYGYANREWQIPNTPQTKFRIGSVTKQFTSMLVMQLRERGKIQLEASVCTYVTPCPDAWKPVTIHHLLTHTSGIPTYTGIAAWRETNMVPKRRDQIVDYVRDLPLQWVPGERFAYNNSGYYLLGVVIESVTGKKYEETLQELILKPLGLADTGYDWTSTILPRRASGYSGRGAALVNAAPLDMQQPYAAGSLYSTVEDLLKWDQALDTERLLPAAAKQIMWTPFLNNYAYGWTIAPPAPASFGGYLRQVHTGGINGFSSVIVRLPGPKLTLIILANNETAAPAAVARDIAAIYFGEPYAIPAPRVVAKVDPAVFDQYAGRYQLGPGFVITMTREGSSLMSQATGQGKFELYPQSETTFFAKVAEITVAFVKGADGKVTHLLLTQGGQTRTARKIE